MAGQSGLDHLMHQAVEYVGEKIHDAIMAFGDKLDQMFGAIRGLGKGAILNVGSPSSGGSSLVARAMNDSPSPSPQAPSKGHERSGPEITPQIQQSVSAVNMSIAKGGEHVSEASLGTIPPTPVSYGMAQTQNKSMRI